MPSDLVTPQIFRASQNSANSIWHKSPWEIFYIQAMRPQILTNTYYWLSFSFCNHHLKGLITSRVMLCNTGWSDICCVTRANLKLVAILLSWVVALQACGTMPITFWFWFDFLWSFLVLKTFHILVLHCTYSLEKMFTRVVHAFKSLIICSLLWPVPCVFWILPSDHIYVCKCILHPIGSLFTLAVLLWRTLRLMPSPARDG